MNTNYAGFVFALSLGIASTIVMAAAPTPPSDRELQQFVDASIAVHDINETSQREQQKARTPEDASKLEDRAGAKMEKAVKAQGLTAERFTQIYEAMQVDPKVRARVTELAKQQTTK